MEEEETGHVWNLKVKILDQEKLIEVYRHYSEFQGMHWPEDAHEAIDFAVTEVAEALDAVLRQDPKWVRHNKKDRDLGMEISQAIMMLAIAADAAGIDIIESTFAWMRAKGYEPELWTGKDYALWAFATQHSRQAHLWGMFGGKNKVVQSACGLEFPEDHSFYKVLSYEKGLPNNRCGQCSNYWETKHGPIKKKFIPFRFFPRGK